MYKEFEAAFEYEETPDQQRAIDETLAGMQGKKPMDRLVCGDVGYGKTEVAMRAAFLAVKAAQVRCGADTSWRSKTCRLVAIAFQSRVPLRW